jgi:hypothetical protein
MAIPIRFAPVLTGNDAVEFYERWYETMDKPDPRRPSDERIKEIKKFFRQHELDELKKLEEHDELGN